MLEFYIKRRLNKIKTGLNNYMEYYFKDYLWVSEITEQKGALVVLPEDLC